MFCGVVTMFDCAGADSLTIVSVVAVLSTLVSVDPELSPHEIIVSERVAHRSTKRNGWFIV
jgi:hypothetical protein